MLLPALVVAVFVVPDALDRTPTSGGFGAQFRYTAAQLQTNIPQREGDFQDVWIASEYLVNGMTDWVRGNTFRNELRARLPDLDVDALGISSDNSRSVGQVQLSHYDAEQLDALAQVSVSILQTRNQVYFPQVGSQLAQVTILDAPVVAPSPPSLPNRFAPVLRIGIGLLLGLLLALVAEALDDRWRDRDELERSGWYILTTIPKGSR